jgi:Ser/Thr protein kinase RdoA (MazF antagonist)
MNEDHSAHPYDALTPDAVLDAVESTGLISDGRLLALNSYENRVYQVGIEESVPIIAKFYRPQRWSRDQILEEHAFTCELQENGLQVVAPTVDAAGKTLHRHGDFLFAVYPRRGGHSPELQGETLSQLGRSMGRLHGIGASKPFKYRQSLTVAGFGVASREFLLGHDFIPGELRAAYDSLSRDLIERVEAVFSEYGHIASQRLHGDCHPGNILWREDSLYFVDFDDCMTGPAIQDLWMLLSGPREQQLLQLSELIEGYDTFHTFNPAELALIESLRTLRLMHYSAWLARRWADPAFPKHFPWFNSVRYWSDHVLELREQMAALDEPPLVLY